MLWLYQFLSCMSTEQALLSLITTRTSGTPSAGFPANAQNGRLYEPFHRPLHRLAHLCVFSSKVISLDDQTWFILASLPVDDSTRLRVGTSCRLGAGGVTRFSFLVFFGPATAGRPCNERWCNDGSQVSSTAIRRSIVMAVSGIADFGRNPTDESGYG